MNDAMSKVTGWISNLNEILIGIIVLGITIGILFDDPFNIIGNIGQIFGQLGDSGLAGLIAVILILIWYKGGKE